MTQGDSTLIEVRGAWRGEVGDPERTFHGVVVQAGTAVPDLVPGVGVTVAYRVGGGRVPGAGEHGTYVLSAPGGHAWPLMRFTCHDMGLTGAQGNDDTAEATWQAVPLPSPTTGRAD